MEWKVFQLPLSGSPGEGRALQEQERGAAFNSLSRDHSSPDRRHFRASRISFNSLSRDHGWVKPQNGFPSRKSAFNSLSRDHKYSEIEVETLIWPDFQLPLSGSLTPRGRARVVDTLHPFNSLSRDHSSIPFTTSTTDCSILSTPSLGITSKIWRRC